MRKEPRGFDRKLMAKDLYTTKTKYKLRVKKMRRKVVKAKIEKRVIIYISPDVINAINTFASDGNESLIKKAKRKVHNFFVLLSNRVLPYITLI